MLFYGDKSKIPRKLLYKDFLFYFIFETGFHCVAMVGLRLTVRLHQADLKPTEICLFLLPDCWE